AVDNSCCTLGPTGTIGNSVATPAAGFILRMVYLSTLALPDTTHAIVPEQSAPAGIHVYPNPAHGILYVDTPPEDRKPWLVQLYTTTGQLITTQAAYENHFPLNIQGVQPGLYLLRLTNAAGLTAPTQKILICN
ncbi:MAG TPA: T9SS type A sorting domain-containing protein, partial [Puia sp.]|nr:T9SS type A sorting domain-containing protein [Puia sp.]